MNRLQQIHGNWANRQFSSHYNYNGTPNPAAPFHHLVDEDKGEVWELAKALESGTKEGIAKELADCQLLLYSIASLCGVDLEEVAWEKYQVNIGRQWGEPDANGVVEHIRPGCVAGEE